MANIAFKKGLLANLPATYAEGTFYVTTDERAMYLDIDNSTRIRIGDFQEVANLDKLQEITNPSTTALYYVTDLNVLAKYNGSAFVQINLDTGATSVEVVGSGNAVTQASYDAVSRKLTLTMGATYTTADDVDSAITTAVGDLGNKESDVPYTNVKEYVDEKVANVVAGSIDGLGELAAKDEVAEDDLESALAAKINDKADVGTDEDEATTDTVKGAKKYASAQASAAETAAKAYADGLVDALDVADSAVATQLVSAVSEEDGKITVTRRALVAEDIPEIAQSKVTGLTDALAGKQDSLVFNTAYDASTNKVATMTDVTNAVAGLSGAMHYIGESTTDPAEEVTVADVEEFAKGDVVTYNAKEYVYDGSTWRELGDESSFAVKGSIKDADIAADAAIAQSKIAGLETALAAKATPADITTAIAALDVEDSAVEGQVVSAVAETDGKITVTRRALVANDIPELAQDKITGLTTALAGKQDNITFETAYDASTNKAATMTDVDAAETAAKEYTDTALAWGSF